MNNNNRPNIRTLEKLEELNNKINELFEQKRKALKHLITKYGSGEFLYELDEPNVDGQKFVRYKLIDQLEAFETGEPIFKATAIERFNYEVRYLKNQPKEK
jgi:hypothetical protein